MGASRARTRKQTKQAPAGIDKCPTGIRGLDEITLGGLPRGRPTLIAGPAGSGKTLFAAEFLARGASQFGEPGVFISFEESAAELTANVASLGIDLGRLMRDRKLVIDEVRIERNAIVETGDFDLEGLFIRVAAAADSVGAKRIALDTIEVLFASFSNDAVVRSELQRLFRWLKDRGLTAMITAEQGGATIARHGIEEYVSDCVITLDSRILDQVATRRLRIIKYRGSSHGTNEYPFLIDHDGISVLPITSLALDHPASTQRISSGVRGLDEMLGGRGYYRGASILISGTAGTGKTSLAASFAEAACRRGQRAVYVLHEESPNQIVRNMRSIGIDLGQWVDKGLLRFEGMRPTAFGLELHLMKIHQAVNEWKPQVVIVDPMTGISAVGSDREVKATLTRMIDFLKSRGITSLYTSLTGEPPDAYGVSSLIDTWLVLRELEAQGERSRLLHVVKSRGMAHSHQVREFRLTNKSIELVAAYIGPDGVFTGTARLNQEARDRAAELEREHDTQKQLREHERRRSLIQSQIAALQAELDAEQEEAERLAAERQKMDTLIEQTGAARSRSRDAHATRGHDQRPNSASRAKRSSR